jgi:hypothetical protein
MPISKKDARKIDEAKADLVSLIECALIDCDDVAEFEPDPSGDGFSVDMSHPEACYIPFRVTVSFREP